MDRELGADVVKSGFGRRALQIHLSESQPPPDRKLLKLFPDVKARPQRSLEVDPVLMRDSGLSVQGIERSQIQTGVRIQIERQRAAHLGRAGEADFPDGGHVKSD